MYLCILILVEFRHEGLELGKVGGEVLGLLAEGVELSGGSDDFVWVAERVFEDLVESGKVDEVNSGFLLIGSDLGERGVR